MPPPDAPMNITVDVEGPRVSLTFPDREAVQAFFGEALPQQAFMLRLEDRLEPFVSFAFLVNDQTSFKFQFKASVMQVFEDGGQFGTAFQFEDWDGSKDLELERKLKTEDAPLAAEGENLGTSPIFRIKQMDLSQKMLLAPKADRGECQVLCRDVAPMVLLGLLSNPRLDAECLLAIVKSNFATGDIFQRVASDRRWMASAEIRTAVVRNPKTPTPIAVRLLETLPLNELRDLAKMGSIREDLRQAAFKALTKLRGGR